MYYLVSPRSNTKSFFQILVFASRAPKQILSFLFIFFFFQNFLKKFTHNEVETQLDFNINKLISAHAQVEYNAALEPISGCFCLIILKIKQNVMPTFIFPFFFNLKISLLQMFLHLRDFLLYDTSLPSYKYKL